ncbi:MAG: family 78 glycoside hydrolase catalytic domain [Arachnia sp.]
MTISALPSAPRFEHHRGAWSVVGVASPRLTWRVACDDPGFEQKGYEVEITRGGESRTYRVASRDQVLVPWPAEPLNSRESARVRVRIVDGEASGPWGESATVEAGLLDAADWAARFISPRLIGGLDEPAPVVFGHIDLPAPVVSARLYATARGIYQAAVNGVRVDDTVLAPGWTAYDKRLRYHAYDVTNHLRVGRNEVSALLGNGWHRGFLGYMGERAVYGDRLAFLAQLEVTTADGAVHLLTTNSGWSAREDIVTADDLYNGQTTDLRRRGEQLRTDRVEELPTDAGLLVAPDGPPMRATGVLPAVAVWSSPSGKTLVDFGQNLVGWVRLRVRGLPEGSQVVVRHAEVIENDELGTRPLRAARATDTWILGPRDEEVLEPSLTLHGFRYAEVTGVPELRQEDIEAVVIGSDLERTGWFECSDARVNRLHENVVWSTRANFVDLPTDCPQRDERLGWTGDLQVFGPTALFLFDVSGLLQSWLADLAAEQYPSGAVPHVVPSMNHTPFPDPEAAAWGDAATIVPWTLYRRTGDVGILAQQLPSMRAWVDRVAALAGADRLWTGGFQFGDWLDPTAPPERPGDAKAAPEVVATAYFARSAAIVAEAGAVLGLDDVAASYGALAAEIRAAFAEAYVTPLGRVLSDAQTVYALALEWDLIPTAEQRAYAGRRLADLVRGSGFTIATGFVGTPLICDALTRAGRVDLAYRMLLQDECPSWLYPVSMGATTIWERWDSMLPDGSVNPGEMTSFNHYALGAVADWLHRVVAGLEPVAPGYRRIAVRPRPTRHLEHATASHESPYGTISAGWRREQGTLVVHAAVPVGVTAEVFLPGADEPVVVGHGEHSWTVTESRAAAPVGSTVRDLIDDEDTWAAVVEAVNASGLVQGEPSLAQMFARYLDRPAGSFVEALSNEVHPYDRPAADHPLHGQVAEILGSPARPLAS